ncbi:MAG TPA: hypothetical protein VLY87_07590 [Flavobacterium sp.]|nr:hypothetical protein [Flavobacterium sp.]
MRNLFIIILFIVNHSNYAQISINERIDNQLKLDVYNDSGTNKLTATFKDFEEKSNILDFKRYSNYILFNFKDPENISGKVINDLSLKEVDFKEYRNVLKRDMLFVNTLQEISDNSLKKIENKPTYDFDEIMNIACKFVKITALIVKEIMF